MQHRNGNRIVFEGELRIGDVLPPLALLHQIKQEDYPDVILDFKYCIGAFAGPLLALCCQAMKLRSEGIDVGLILPERHDLARLFRNSNWAHFLSPDDFDVSQFKGFTQVPAIRFADAEEQKQAVNRIMNGILGAIPDLERDDLAALEWAVNEITDNVLVHSQSQFGGLVQLSTFKRVKKSVEFVVADGGVGIPHTLRQMRSDLSDAAALEQSIKEGVTRDKRVGQGNGLFGTYQICSHSKGYFQLESFWGKLAFSERYGLRVATEKIPFEGTLVDAQINLAVPDLLREALRFGGAPHIPVDFVELQYEQAGRDEIVFVVRSEAESCGSRIAGTPVRTKLLNLVKMCPQQRIIIDFSDLPIVSSSFADEAFGKLFVELGPLTFTQKFEFRNVASTVKQLIDRAVMQRIATTQTQKT